jgi:hypothetical protein
MDEEYNECLDNQFDWERYYYEMAGSFESVNINLNN